MKVAYDLVQARREKLAQMLQGQSYIPIQEVCSHLQISEATARRDLAHLESHQRIVRTYGGALVEYNQKFPSFLERQQIALKGKKKMAKAAWELIRPKSTCFFDAGTTIYSLAQELKAKPVKEVKIITNSLPIAELLSGVQGIEVYLLAGQYLHRQGVIFGEATIKSVRFYKIDDAFMSAEGFDSKGLWNSDATVVDFQKQVIKQSKRKIFCLGAEKMSRKAPSFLSDWGQVDVLISDAISSDLPVYSQPKFKGKIFSI
ncbi:MAG: DeoR/GlpR family DNA-binding transcription regulator [Verrucomicrobiota bacterium]